jgi:4-amino-4-deoxy-L-arabinose transferase-like glycosyltransferase
MKPRGDTTLLAALVIAFLAPVLVAIGAGLSFGYDEAVYAQLTRHWLTGAPASGWDLHRPPGLSVLALVPQALGPGLEWPHRLIGAAAGAGVVAAGWWAARIAGGRVAGLVAAVALATAAPLQVESATFLTDVPSTLVLLVLAALVWRHLDGQEPPGPSFAWLGLLAAVAVYLRYGVLVELGGLVVAAIAVAPRKLLAGWRAVAAALAVFVVSLAPHVVIAIAETGAPWGIIALAARAAGGGDDLPLIRYAAWFPWRLIGPLGAAVALVGIVAAIRRGSRAGFARFIGVAALVPIAVLGTLVHAEPRYLLFPMTLLVVLGAVELAGTLANRSRGVRVALSGVAVAGLLLAAVTTGIEMRERADAFNWKRDIGRDIAGFAGPAPAPNCSILTADVPIMSWYSGCHAVNYLTGPETDRLALLTGSHRFIVIRADGHLQPPPDVLARMVAGAEPWRTYEDGYGATAAVVYRLPDQ